MRKKVLLITGLTATGKSDFAIKCAKLFDGEIISCDSVQIYRGLNIGSNKTPMSERHNVPHYMIDIKDPNENYSVGEFVKDAKNAIDEVLAKDKLPILVGGTGLYIEALLKGFNFGEVSSHEDFRTEMMHIADNDGKMAVWEILNRENPDLASKVHPNNLKRVIRYLEIARYGSQITTKTALLDDYDTLSICLIKDRVVLYDKINARVDKMFEEGLLTEVKNILKSTPHDAQSMSAIGYKEVVQYLAGDFDLETCKSLIKQHTRNYAKRQLTYFKRIDELQILDITNDTESAFSMVADFVNK